MIQFLWLTGYLFAHCIICSTDFTISHSGRNDVAKHLKDKHHQEIAKVSSSTRALASYYKPQVAQSVIEAETWWPMFVCKHNLAFLISDHATKLFVKMFPDSEIAKKFACGRTKTTAIIKETLAPYFLQKTKENMASHFSIMMDKSNDKTDN